ncbi:MAG: hypothetical protein V8R61_07105 [Enterocloster sp.]
MMEALLKKEGNKAAYDQELRKAAKDIIYMYLNAVVRNQAYAEETGDRSVLKPAIRAPFPTVGSRTGPPVYWY